MPFEDAEKYFNFFSYFEENFLNLWTQADKLLPSSSKFIDFGCGVGNFSASMSAFRPSATLVGIDRSQNFIEFADQKFSSRSTKFLCQQASEISASEARGAEVVVFKGSFHLIANDLGSKFFEPSRFPNLKAIVIIGKSLRSLLSYPLPHRAREIAITYVDNYTIEKNYRACSLLGRQRIATAFGSRVEIPTLAYVSTIEAKIFSYLNAIPQEELSIFCRSLSSGPNFIEIFEENYADIFFC